MDMRVLTTLILGVSIGLTAWPQAQQKGIDPTKRYGDKIQIEYFGYRAATWEDEEDVVASVQSAPPRWSSTPDQH